MVYEGGIRVPMCGGWPGKIQPDSRTSQIALTMDLFPTICEAAGAEIPHSIDGISIPDILTGQTKTLPERDLFWTRREGGNRYMGKTIRAIRRGDWKLLQNSPMEPFRLYNLRGGSAGRTRSLGKPSGAVRRTGRSAASPYSAGRCSALAETKIWRLICVCRLTGPEYSPVQVQLHAELC